MKLKNGIFAILLMIAMLALVPAVSAVDYSFWDSHFIDLPTAETPSAGVSPSGIQHVYSDSSPIIGPTMGAVCAAKGGTVVTYWGSEIRGIDQTGGYGHYRSYIYSLTSAQDPAAYYVMYPAAGTNSLFRKGQNNGSTSNWAYVDGAAFQDFIKCRINSTDTIVRSGPTYVYHAGSSPIDYNYPNLTIKIFSTSTGITIPRVDVSVQVNPDLVLSGKTDLNGEVFFGMVGSNSLNSNKTITVSKVGYNTSVTFVNLTEDKYVSVHLSDAAWDTSGTKAVVYLDIIDESTSAAISGATIGIKNTTNEINPWYYNTYSDSTIAFTTDGTNDLAVGQVVEFAGYKSGSYSAGHTDPVSILAPVTRTSLKLTKSDVVDPIDIVNGSYYWYPVTVVDSVSGNAISGSSLNYQVTDDLYWINKTSATGKFNITGKGMMGLFPLENGDTIMIEGNADGYIRGGFALGVDSDNTGTTQYVNLVPSDYAPNAGNFTAVFLAYDDDTTAALSGVSLELKKASFSTSKTTGTSGSATFKNLIGGDTYTLTAIKSGYTTLTKTITGGSGNVVSIDVPMSSESINPTWKPTTITTYGPGYNGSITSSELNEKGASGLNELMDLVITGKLWLLGLLLIVVFAVRKAFGVGK